MYPANVDFSSLFTIPPLFVLSDLFQFLFPLIFLFVFKGCFHSACSMYNLTEFFFPLRSIHVPWVYLFYRLYYNYIQSAVHPDYNYSCNLNLFYSTFSQIRLSDLLAARILRFTDFDTLIYTCAPEFDFMEKEVFFLFLFFPSLQIWWFFCP